MITVKDIMKEAISSGACNNSGKATNWKSLCWLFFTPQGREFCENNNFPSLDIFRQMKPHVYKHGVFVDAGDIELKNNANIAVIGNTNAHLLFDDNTKVHKVIIMHGGKVTIDARNYSVVLLVNVGNNNVEIINDKTARILW